jgi:hypothetical protein
VHRTFHPHRAATFGAEKSAEREEGVPRRKPPKPWIPLNSSRSGGHLRRRHGSEWDYYCENCGKFAFTAYMIFPDKRIFCSRECQDAYYPKWLTAVLSLIVYAALIAGFWPWIRGAFEWMMERMG